MTIQWINSRQLSERIVIKGRLELITPAHFGVGDAESPIDMTILRDEVEGRALLPGSSIAGALRGSLQMQNPELADRLFGYTNDKQSFESYIIVDDALGDIPKVELRDGIAQDPKTRTAADKKKFDFELLEAGSAFDLCFELLVPKDKGNELIEGFAMCLKSLENGDIRLGKRKRRGFGKCEVGTWKVFRYDMTSPEGMFHWLELDEKPINNPSEGHSIAKILLGKDLPAFSENWCELDADFEIDGSILISSNNSKEVGSDIVHLHSSRDGVGKPIISGTSLAGALRGRVLKISNTFGKKGYDVANSLFGVYAYEGETDLELTASRIWVDEAEITNGIELVQNRIKIDRFTGGAYDKALFNEQPILNNAGTGFHLKLRLLKPKPEEVGLLVLLLKDLWTGNLPLGGGSSIGRGRLIGKRAELLYEDQKWIIAQKDADELIFSGNGNKDDLQKFVDLYIERG